jgi:hypothetical protein
MSGTLSNHVIPDALIETKKEGSGRLTGQTELAGLSAASLSGFLCLKIRNLGMAEAMPLLLTKLE